MRPFLKLFAVIFILCGIILTSLDILYTWSITQTPLFGIRDNRRYDYLVAGDSRTNALLPFYMDHVSGLRTINVGFPSFTFEDTREMLEYFFAKGNHTDYVLLQMDQRFGTAFELKKQWKYEPYLMRERGFLHPRIPFHFYAENNKNITFAEVTRSMKLAMKGQVDTGATDSIAVLNSNTPFRFNEKLLEDNSRKHFRMEEIEKLRAYLKQKGVKELILFTAPFAPNWFPSQSDTSSFKQQIKKAGYQYHDFSTVYDDTAYFKDYTHVKNKKYLEFSRLFVQTIMTPATDSLSR